MIRRLRAVPFGAIALWGTAIAGALALALPQTQFASTVFLVAFAALYGARYRSWRGDVPGVTIVLAAAGLLLGTVPLEAVSEVGDGLLAAAIVSVAVMLAVTLVRVHRPGWKAVAASLVLRSAALGHELQRADRNWWYRAASYVSCGALALALLASVAGVRGDQGWKIVGAHDGAAVWNAAVLDGALARDGAHVRDSRFVSAAAPAPAVGIADAPALTAVKLVRPAPIDGPAVIDIVGTLDVFAVFAAAVWFVMLLSGTFLGAVIAVAVAVTMAPLLPQIAAASPFDLWPALVTACAAAYRRFRWWPFAAAALGGFLNVAVGYETAFAAGALALANRLDGRRAGALAALGAASSVLAGATSHALAPDVTMSFTWWSANDIVRTLRATDVSFAPAAGALLLAVVVAAWIVSYRRRPGDHRVVSLVLAAAAALALPAMLGGVPLIVPAAVLKDLPLGWPSARFVELFVLVAVVPVAFVARAAVSPSLRAPIRALAVIVLAALAFVDARPVAPRVLTPPIPSATMVLEMPVSEPGSRASMLYADDLLERGALVTEPVAYLSTPPLVARSASFDAAQQDEINAFASKPGAKIVVVRDDVYDHPEEQYAEPTVIRSADSAKPDLLDTSHVSYVLRDVSSGEATYDLRTH
jgi:hypothetical protein